MSNAEGGESVIPYGYCACGCGSLTSIIKHTNNKQGKIKGEPAKFINGHVGKTIIHKRSKYCKSGLHLMVPENIKGTGCKACDRAGEQRRRKLKQEEKAKEPKYCKRGHLRTSENVNERGYCKTCLRLSLTPVKSDQLCACGCGQKTNIAVRSIVAKNIIKGQPLDYVHGHIGKISNKKEYCVNGHAKTPENTYPSNKGCKLCSRINQKDRYLSNKPHILKITKQWANNNKEKRKAIANKYAKKATNELYNTYVAFSTFHMSAAEIPKYGIELAREMILTKRTIKEITQ